MLFMFLRIFFTVSRIEKNQKAILLTVKEEDAKRDQFRSLMKIEVDALQRAKDELSREVETCRATVLSQGELTNNNKEDDYQ